MPHIHCYLDRPSIVWSMVVTDTLIGLLYMVISVTLYFLVRRVKLPFHSMFLAFGLFILACGATHFMEVYNLWVPNYWLSVFVKAITAGASVTTAIYLLKQYPQIVDLVEAAKSLAETKTNVEQFFKERTSTPPEIKSLLSRMLFLPLSLAGVIAIAAVFQVVYLRNIQGWLDHSTRVIILGNIMLHDMQCKQAIELTAIKQMPF